MLGGAQSGLGLAERPESRARTHGYVARSSTLPAYQDQASVYDIQTERFDHWRQRLIDLLPLQVGNVVLDVGCGTGLCFPRLLRRVGATGVVVGIDESAEMLAVARRRIADNGWSNVTLIESAVEYADIPVTADAALFSAVHDILRSGRALQNVFAHLHVGAWVAAGGGKWALPWMGGLNLLVLAVHQRYVRDFEGFDRPWSRLERFVDDLRIEEVEFGTGYLAVGRARPVHVA